MKPFPPPDMVWAPGETRWHCYALPDFARDVPLADLVKRARAAAVGVAGTALAPVADEWVHATVHMISLPAAELEPGSIHDLVRTLTRLLADVPPFTLTAGSPWAADGSVLLGLSDADSGADLAAVPSGSWNALSGLVGQAISDRFGSQASQYVPPPPHFSLAYCAEPTDGAPIEASLRALDQASSAGPVRMTVSEIYLVDVRQNAAAHTYTWDKDTAIRVRLGGGGSDGGG